MKAKGWIMPTLRSFGAVYIFRKDILAPCPPNGFDFDHVKHLFNGVTKSFTSNLRCMRKPFLPLVLSKFPAFAKA